MGQSGQMGQMGVTDGMPLLERVQRRPQAACERRSLREGAARRRQHADGLQTRRGFVFGRVPG